MFIPVWVIGFAVGLAVFAIVAVLRAFFRVRRGASTFRAVAEGSSDGLVLMERDSRIIWANEAYCRTMGYTQDEIIGRYPLDFALPPEAKLPLEEVRAFRFDPGDERFDKLTHAENIRANGERFIHEFSHAVIRSGKDTRFLLASRDVTERMEREQQLIAAQEKLRLMSHQDSLTGLANRHFFDKTLEGLIASGEPFAVLQIDMNGFKGINDTYGHAAGDSLLAHFADVLTSIAEDDWHCARVGGDEFTVLIPGVWALGVALAQASRIFDETQVPMVWQTRELCPSVSVGAAVYNGQGQSSKDVLSRADIALYAAKQAKPSRIAGYDDDMHRAHRAKQALQHDFSEALARGRIGFELVPVVDVKTHQLHRFDLQPVWDHPQHGHQTSRDLRRIAGHLRQTDALERRMIQCARDCLARLRSRGLVEVGVGLSLSEAALSDRGGRDDLAWLTEDESLMPGILSLIFPGNCLGQIGDLTEVKSGLARLSRSGVRIYMDNPGLDVSWVQNLSGVTVDGIILHRTLVQNIDTDTTAQALVTAGAGLAALLGQAVVTQGVERAAQIKVLQGVGCHEISGPAVAPPMSLDDAVTWAKNDGADWSIADDDSPKGLSA